MKPKSTDSQRSLFSFALEKILHPDHPLVVLSSKIDWSQFDDLVDECYSEEGRPGCTTRLMIGLLYLKHAFNESDESVVARWVVPIGFGVWLAHYGFHFWTGCLTVVLVTQNAAMQLWDRPVLGQPMWHLGGLPESIVFPMEMGFMGLGLVGSWIVGWSIAGEWSGRYQWGAFAPWALLHLVLFVVGVYTMTQPMDMRGTFLRS